MPFFLIPQLMIGRQESVLHIPQGTRCNQRFDRSVFQTRLQAASHQMFRIVNCFITAYTGILVSSNMFTL